MREAGEHLVHYRRTLGEAAAEHKLALAAMTNFPLTFWPEQSVTPKERYGAIIDDLQMIGLPQHAVRHACARGVPRIDRRVDLIMRLTPYLPLLLALSTSPFWQGHLTGLVGYRSPPKTRCRAPALPELFSTNDDYDEFVTVLTWAKIIPTRATSGERCGPRSSRCSAARCARSTATARSTPASTASAAPLPKRNKWHAQRYDIAATFVDPLARWPLTLGPWLDQMFDYIVEDIERSAEPRICAACTASSPWALAQTGRSNSIPRRAPPAAGGLLRSRR